MSEGGKNTYTSKPTRITTTDLLRLKKKIQARIMYTAKLSFQFDGEIVFPRQGTPQQIH